MTNILNINVTFEPSDEVLKDLFITAIEGGINYWCYVDEYSHSIDEWYAKISDKNDEDSPDFPPSRIDINTIKLGLERLFALPVGTHERLKKEMLMLIMDDDNFDYDASDADVIVQLGCLGEEVYG